jgi:glycosyltransferase involved in cell wall biosynthesis
VPIGPRGNRLSLSTKVGCVKSEIAPSQEVPRYLMVVKNLRFFYSHFIPMAKAVQRAGWEVWIIAAENDSPQRLLDAGMKYIELEEEGGHWNFIKSIRSLRAIRTAVREISPPVIHFIYLKDVLLGSILARFCRFPAVLGAVTGLGSLFAQDRLSYRFVRSGVLLGLRWGFQHPNAVLAFDNGFDRDYFVARRVLSKSRTVIIPGAGVEVDEIRPRPMPTGLPVILCACRMIRDKGILELAEAARILHRRGIKFELWLAGGSDTLNPSAITPAELEGIEAEGIAKWLGHRDDLPVLLGSASIFCLPTYYREGLPRVLVEASAAGLPIVTTDIPGCRDVVTHERNGLLVPPRDVEALANALQNLIENHEKRGKMRLQSRQVFEEKFTSEVVRRALNQCYSKLSIPLVLSETFRSASIEMVEDQLK